MNLQNKTILFLGDSITEGACAVGVENVYHQVCAKILGANTVIDGISGSRIARKHIPSETPRFDLDFNKRLAEHNENIDFAVIFGGVNDFGHGDAPFGEDGDTTPDTFVGAVNCLCKTLKEKYVENAAFILPMHNIHDSNPFGEFGKKPAAGKLLREYGLKIKEIASSYGYPVLDLWDDPKLNPLLPENEPLFADGLHPTNAGHKLLGERVAGFLQSL